MPMFGHIKFAKTMQDSFLCQDSIDLSMGSLEELLDFSTTTDNQSEKSDKSSKSGSGKSATSATSAKSGKSVVFQRRLDTTMDRVFKTGVDKVQSLLINLSFSSFCSIFDF